jgi:hypothetical protein
MVRHSSVIPFLVHISNESKHIERFAVRAKAMTLRPEANRYVAHIDAIRTIQDYLRAAADRRDVPQVDNTNVDRSLAVIHATVLGCLRRTTSGMPLVTATEHGKTRCEGLLEEYEKFKAASWSGRNVLAFIRAKVAAGEQPSPPDGPSTSAPSTAQTTTTPVDPLTVVLASRRLSHNTIGQDAWLRQNGMSGGREEEEEEGDNESFFGSKGTSECGLDGEEGGDTDEDEVVESVGNVEDTGWTGDNGGSNGVGKRLREKGVFPSERGSVLTVETDEGGWNLKK